MSYCSSLTDNQVIKVLKDEKSRMERHPNGDIRRTAESVYHEAREVCLRRGIDPDEELE